MELVFVPEYGWQVWAAALALSIAALTVALWFRRQGREMSARARAGVAGLTVVSAALLALALCGPAISRRLRQTYHAVVLLDVSDSILRREGGWQELRPKLVDHLRHSFSQRASATATARVLTFSSQASTFGARVPLRSVWQEVAKLTPSSFAVGGGTDIANGLKHAGDEIDRTGGRGAVILISDGNETDGDAAEEARRLAQAGIPVYIMPIEGGNPELMIDSANLPPYVESGRETFARGVFRNAGSRSIDAELELARRALTEDSTAAARESQRKGVHLESGEWGRFRTPVLFENPGLQYVDLTLSKGPRAHRRRLFTYVESPPRVLSLGDDLWTQAFPPGALLVDRKTPKELTAKDLARHYDGIVIDSVPAGEFAPEVLAKIAEMVKDKGAGLFLMNGRHSGPANGPTNLMTFNDTPIEPLAPLVARPRPHETERARTVVMMLDGSSSMGGWPLQAEQQIATYIVDQLLTPKDHLEVLAFTTSCEVVLANQELTGEGKARAIDRIKSIAANGGTDPRDCMKHLAGRKMNNCGIVFLSDGYFDKGIAVDRPDCRVTAFGIGRDSFPPGDPLRELADPIGVGHNFDPTNIRIPYFQKRPEDRYFEPGGYQPLGMSFFQPRGQVEIPTIRLEGSATTYPKLNANLMAVRPKLTDPVLAYQEYGGGNVGEFTSSLPDGWLSREDGRRAIRQWISETLPFADKRRYLFQISQHGGDLDLEITLTPQKGSLPRVEHLDGVLDVAGGARIDVPLIPDPAVPAIFRGRIRTPASTAPMAGSLVLRESGPDAQVRPQRIPILIPPAGEVAGPLSPEAWTYGLNEELLRRVAAAGGGSYDAIESAGSATSEERPDATPIWQVFAATGCACYLGAVLWRRLDR
jgi:Mg-chelatase subunit ChlD